TIPVGVKSIGGRAFDGTPMEKSALRQQSMHIVNSILLRAEGFGRFAVPETVTAIAGGAFENTGFTELIVPDSVTELDEKAFYYMEFLSKITLPSGIRKLPAGAFQLCLALEEYTVPDSVTAIGDGAFSNCRNLKDIYIPESVTFIGKDVFEKDIEDSVQLTIHGKAGSAAEEAAKREGIPFIAE
ncbi:MAG: leucine-rich repeat domain-containing protein, partial [Oscillospiraceae bacterium]|nr:leucine-rich repeat domain-containing protein [Oscillospiraceae bacterium]